ncbi:MAG: hypothetical protein KAJ86_05140 [Alphaproteobacteria bacterium]|nr:hypothetical protein [Alphaproteobacteria bacterium]
MPYWVYENWTHKKAIIHSSECSYCKNGQGIHATSSKQNGEWHGEFEDIDSAFKKAENTGRDEIRTCKICSP